MSSVFIEFPKTKMNFHLFDDEVDPKMAKKLLKLGLADLSVDFTENPDEDFVLGADGLYRADGFAKDGFPVTDVTASSTFSTIFNADTNSLTVHLEGRFFCFNTLDAVQPINQWKDGYVWAIRLRNDKGKLIKKPKDEWGMSVPIEALAEKDTYGGGAHKISFSIHVENETFYG